MERGSIFLVPLMDETNCLGQVIGREPDALNSVAIALFDIRGNWEEEKDVPALGKEAIFSLMLVTRDLLDSGRWRVLGERASGILGERRPYEDLRAIGFVGAKIRGSGLVEEFADAFYGLAPWDDWYGLSGWLPDFVRQEACSSPRVFRAPRLVAFAQMRPVRDGIRCRIEVLERGR